MLAHPAHACRAALVICARSESIYNKRRRACRRSDTYRTITYGADRCSVLRQAVHQLAGRNAAALVHRTLIVTQVAVWSIVGGCCQIDVPESGQVEHRSRIASI